MKSLALIIAAVVLIPISQAAAIKTAAAKTAGFRGGVIYEMNSEKKTRDLPANLIIGPSFVPFLKQHWVEIQEQKKVGAALAVLDYMDTFSFVFEKMRDSKSEGRDTVIVRMKPYNIFISSFVSPIYFVVKADGSRIMQLKGRMLPKRKIGTHWEDFDGEAVFTY